MIQAGLEAQLIPNLLTTIQQLKQIIAIKKNPVSNYKDGYKD